MSGIICKSVMENCQNSYDSFGEICVGCNCCGRFGEDTMWQARYNMAIERIQDNVRKLQDKYFQSNLQQKNGCTNISYWSKELEEILTHLDFDKEKGADDEQREAERT